MNKLRMVWVYLNFWRILPAYLFFRTNKFKAKCLIDLEEWVKRFAAVKEKGKLIQFGYIVLFNKVYRNILLNRLHRNLFMCIIARILFAPLSSCYINMPPENIGGGLFLQHGFSTIIAAKEIGERCHINQQVTIGYDEKDSPVIGNNVLVAAGAIVIGKVNIGDNAKVGAGAVVVKDVPANATVVGVAAKVVKIAEV